MIYGEIRSFHDGVYKIYFYLKFKSIIFTERRLFEIWFRVREEDFMMG